MVQWRTKRFLCSLLNPSFASSFANWLCSRLPCLERDGENVTTLAGYLGILDESALLTGLQKYAKDEARKRGSVPKFQVYNNALLTAYKGRGYMVDRTDTRVWGRWVESAVGAHLLSMADELDYDVYYWREPSKKKDEEVISCFKKIKFWCKEDFQAVLEGHNFCIFL